MLDFPFLNKEKSKGKICSRTPLEYDVTALIPILIAIHALVSIARAVDD